MSEFEIIIKLDPKSSEARRILENLRSGKGALEQISPTGPSPESRTAEPIDAGEIGVPPTP